MIARLTASVASTLLDLGPVPTRELRDGIARRTGETPTFNDLGAALHWMRRNGYIDTAYGPGGTHVPLARARELL